MVPLAGVTWRRCIIAPTTLFARCKYDRLQDASRQRIPTLLTDLTARIAVYTLVCNLSNSSAFVNGTLSAGCGVIFDTVYRASMSCLEIMRPCSPTQGSFVNEHKMAGFGVMIVHFVFHATHSLRNSHCRRPRVFSRSLMYHQVRPSVTSASRHCRQRLLLIRLLLCILGR
ncbi:hypothetical protein OE88DRAFT_246327 [Heliocybe sulcata]|uniref:Uncharacterized protein n=1 Tax=Heliocybe sulcata TaxID=5364 RepID=A0A5C3MYH8_9AGAM|nr:hypothetical protein OE88DRAFT_246327 [Heliocybe sulcata]